MIYKLHERNLRIVLNDQTSNFETLLVESSDICNHQEIFQTHDGGTTNSHVTWGIKLILHLESDLSL